MSHEDGGGTPAPPHRARLSSAAVVGISAKGVSLPVYGDHRRMNLDLPALVLLAELARPEPVSLAEALEHAAATSDDAARLGVLLDELTRRGLLTDQQAMADVPADAHVGGATATEGRRLILLTPVLVGVGADGYEARDHHGRVLARLTPLELLAVSEYRFPMTAAEAFEAHRRAVGDAALDEAAFTRLTERVLGTGLIDVYREGDPAHEGAQGRADRGARHELTRMNRLVQAVAADTSRREARRRDLDVEAGHRRPSVVPVHHNGAIPPLALGMIFAYAKAYDGGRLERLYDLDPDWLVRKTKVRQIVADGPAIFLFSNYIWSDSQNLALSAMVKQHSPESLTVHGGPSAPKYDLDARQFLRAHPHIDVLVRGEGEVTAAELLDALGGRLEGRNGDLSELRDVAGLTFRDGDRVVRTPDRPRLADLDELPSPYLTGLFDVYGEATSTMATVETNRGCPYGCTFCDWGSATNSRIRKFALDRVYAELDWCAERKMPLLAVADANFGIFARDVDIARYLAGLRERHGYPRQFVTNYAKNTVKHLEQIVEIVADSGIVTQGLLSLQTTDADTLSAVERTNIKLERYEDLARAFRRAKLPLYVDLMLGLPGSTVDSFRTDLQMCIDSEVSGKIYLTELLPNSPMNEPGYRERHAIETGDLRSWQMNRKAIGSSTNRALVVASTTFSRDDHAHMLHLRRVFLLAENLGTLRYVGRFVRQEAGFREIDFFERLAADAVADRERYPTIAAAFLVLPDLLVPPVSWATFDAELHTYLVTEVGLADDSALRAVLAAQHALQPARDRSFPETVDLDHDVAAWYNAAVAAKDKGLDWTATVPRLIDHGPGRLTVDDLTQVCALGLGYRIDYDYHVNWELTSPMARPVPNQHQNDLAIEP